MNSNAAMKLETVHGQPVVLEGSAITGEIKDLISQVAVRQTYRNHEAQPIEAVYSFPMPLDAVLLKMEVKIGERVLKGQVLPKQEAEDRYEEAITDGDSAMMLQQVEPGMYTANVGNIAPGESVTLEMCYTTRHELRDGQLRFRLPTVIAPRYGDYTQAGFQDHQVPETGLEAEQRFTFNLKATGTLSAGTINSPSHQINTKVVNGATEITLANQSAQMDRDIIIMFEPTEPLYASAYQGMDLDSQHSVVAFFTPRYQPTTRLPRHVKLLLDCSGSMHGEKMRRARDAALAVIGDLGEGDYFNVTFFGSHFQSIFEGMVPATEFNLQRARQVVEQTNADFGGTNMDMALDHVHQLRHPEGKNADVLLVTDGEVTSHQRIIDTWSTRESRVFTIGIGNQVTEALLKGLADATNGACELVVLNEKIEQAIMRQFKRIGQARITKVDITWPEGAQPQSLSLPKAIFTNDAFWLNAKFNQPLAGMVAVTLTLANGETIEQKAAIDSFVDEPLAAGQASTVARLAASDRIARESDEERAKEQAVAYQLISPYTHYIYVDVRDDGAKMKDLPALRKVKQMAPAGWDMGVTRSFAPMGATMGCDVKGLVSTRSFGAKPSKKTFGPKIRGRRPHTIFPDLSLHDLRDQGQPPFIIPDNEVIETFNSNDIATYLQKLAASYGTPQALLNISQDAFMQLPKPDKLDNFIRKQLSTGVSFTDALVQALVKLAGQHGSELDRETRRYFMKLGKLHTIGKPLDQELAIAFG